MNLHGQHEAQLRAEAHELRPRPAAARGRHESRTGAAAHEAARRLHQPAGGGRPVWPAGEQPAIAVRCISPLLAGGRLPAYEGALAPPALVSGAAGTALEAPRVPVAQVAGPPAPPAAPRLHQMRGRTRAAIHARHLTRVRYQEELRAFHLALRSWRRMMRERARLLVKLASVERRLARQAAAGGRRPRPAIVFEMEGAWYRQVGRRRPVALRSAPEET